jgi:hypothetical protein
MAPADSDPPFPKLMSFKAGTVYAVVSASLRVAERPDFDLDILIAEGTRYGVSDTDIEQGRHLTSRTNVTAVTVTENLQHSTQERYKFYNYYYYYYYLNCFGRLCGLVVRVPGYRSRGPGSIPGTTRVSDKYWVWKGLHSAS